jgi:hypothetical protein
MPTLAQASQAALAYLEECARRLALTDDHWNKHLAQEATKVADDFEEVMRSELRLRERQCLRGCGPMRLTPGIFSLAGMNSTARGALFFNGSNFTARLYTCRVCGFVEMVDPDVPERKSEET